MAEQELSLAFECAKSWREKFAEGLDTASSSEAVLRVDSWVDAVDRFTYPMEFRLALMQCKLDPTQEGCVV